VAREEDVESVGLVSLDEDAMALLELLDQAEDCEAGELTRGHLLDHAPGPRLPGRLESGGGGRAAAAWAARKPRWWPIAHSPNVSALLSVVMTRRPSRTLTRPSAM